MAITIHASQLDSKSRRETVGNTSIHRRVAHHINPQSIDTPPRHITACQDRRTARLTTDHRERRTDNDHATTTDDGHADGHATGTARHDHMHGYAHVTHGYHRHERHRHRHMTAHARTNTTRHATRQHVPPVGKGTPRIKNRAAGPLVLPLNAPQTIFELRVTHEIFTRIGYATVVAPVGVSRIHLG